MDAPKAQTEITFKVKWEDAKNKFNQVHVDLFEFINGILNLKKKYEAANEIEVYLKEIIKIMEKYPNKINESSSDIFSEDGLYDMIIRFSLKNKQIELNNKLASLYNVEKETLTSRIGVLTYEIEKLKKTNDELTTQNVNTSTENNKAIGDLKKQLDSANTAATINAEKLKTSQKTSNDSITELLTTLQTISFNPQK